VRLIERVIAHRLGYARGARVTVRKSAAREQRRGERGRRRAAREKLARRRAGRARRRAGRAGGLVEGQSMCLQSTILSHLSAELLRPPLRRGHPSAMGLPLQSPLACRVRHEPPPPRLLCSSAPRPTLRLQPSGNLQFLSYPTPSFLQFINCDVVCACALLCCAYCLCSGLWCECVICIYFILCFACASEPVNVPIYLCLSA